MAAVEVAAVATAAAVVVTTGVVVVTAAAAVVGVVAAAVAVMVAVAAAVVTTDLTTRREYSTGQQEGLDRRSGASEVNGGGKVLAVGAGGYPSECRMHATSRKPRRNSSQVWMVRKPDEPPVLPGCHYDSRQ